MVALDSHGQRWKTLVNPFMTYVVVRAIPDGRMITALAGSTFAPSTTETEPCWVPPNSKSVDSSIFDANASITMLFRHWHWSIDWDRRATQEMEVSQLRKALITMICAVFVHWYSCAVVITGEIWDISIIVYRQVHVAVYLERWKQITDYSYDSAVSRISVTLASAWMIP